MEYGIFSIIGAMVAVVGIIMATRLIYIDKQYSERIMMCEKDIVDLDGKNHEMKTGVNDPKENDENNKLIQSKISFYKGKTG